MFKHVTRSQSIKSEQITTEIMTKSAAVHNINNVNHVMTIHVTATAKCTGRQAAGSGTASSLVGLHFIHQLAIWYRAGMFYGLLICSNNHRQDANLAQTLPSNINSLSPSLVLSLSMVQK